MSGSRPWRSRPALPRWLGSLLLAAGFALALPGASAAPKQRAEAQADDAGLANVTFTGFRLLDDCRSLVYVELTSKVTVNVEKRNNVVVYRLDGARVGLRNNKNPLITSRFASILDSARWVVNDGSKKKKKKGAAAAETSPHVELVLTLREAATPTHVLREGKAGAVLEITLPKSAGK